MNTTQLLYFQLTEYTETKGWGSVLSTIIEVCTKGWGPKEDAINSSRGGDSGKKG